VNKQTCRFLSQPFHELAAEVRASLSLGAFASTPALVSVDDPSPTWLFREAATTLQQFHA
jgi:hypothetical protein